MTFDEGWGLPPSLPLPQSLPPARPPRRPAPSARQRQCGGSRAAAAGARRPLGPVTGWLAGGVRSGRVCSEHRRPRARSAPAACPGSARTVVSEEEGPGALRRAANCRVFRVNCVRVLHNRGFQAGGFCFVPSCSSRAGVVDVSSTQAAVLKPLCQDKVFFIAES